MYIIINIDIHDDDDDCPKLSCPPEGGTQVRKRKRREIEETDVKQELRRQAWSLTQVHLGQGCRLLVKGENMDGGVGLDTTRKAEGARD